MGQAAPGQVNHRDHASAESAQVSNDLLQIKYILIVKQRCLIYLPLNCRGRYPCTALAVSSQRGRRPPVVS
jgi:hypothetical protein